jgi:hypothetical protein
MGRILLIIAAVVAAFFLIGPLLGLLKWALIIGAVVVGVMFFSRWYHANKVKG